MKLAIRMNEISHSLTMAITTKAKAMKAEEIDVCNFSGGEPDFETPVHIREAVKKAIDEGKTKLGSAAGEPKLKEAIARKLREENGLAYDAQNVVVTNGVKFALFALMLALIEPGDEVIIPSPYWLTYPEIVRLVGGNPVIVRTNASQSYKITAEQLRASITPRTKLLVLNSPSNPTGMVYSPTELEALAKVIVEKDILVVSDEIYEKILYDKVQHFSIGSLGLEIFERTITCGGFSKAFSMTGWRLGYIAAPIKLIEAVTILQSQSVSAVCTFAQYGALASLEGSLECVEQMRQAFAQRRDLMFEHLHVIPGLSCLKPKGAFYIFVDISKTGLKSVEFCNALLESQQVAVIPGIAFGINECIRFSYTTDFESIVKGMSRLEKFVASL